MSYVFSKWTDELGNNLGASSTLTVTVSKDMTVIANYILSSVNYSLTIVSATGGYTSPAAGDSVQPGGVTVNVTAFPSSGYNFVNWLLDNVPVSGNPIGVTMNANHVLRPVFSTVTPPPVGEGTLRVNVYKDAVEVNAQVEIVGVGTFTSPFSTDLPVGTYTLNITYQGSTKTKATQISNGVITPETFDFTTTTPPPPTEDTWKIVAISAIALLGGILLGGFRRKKK